MSKGKERRYSSTKVALQKQSGWCVHEWMDGDFLSDVFGMRKRKMGEETFFFMLHVEGLW